MARVGPRNVYLTTLEHKVCTCRILHPTAQKNDETTIKVNDSIGTQGFPFNNCFQKSTTIDQWLFQHVLKRHEVLYKLF
jgi:hypothetical protein